MDRARYFSRVEIDERAVEERVEPRVRFFLEGCVAVCEQQIHFFLQVIVTLHRGEIPDHLVVLEVLIDLVETLQHTLVGFHRREVDDRVSNVRKDRIVELSHLPIERIFLLFRHLLAAFLRQLYLSINRQQTKIRSTLSPFRDFR